MLFLALIVSALPWFPTPFSLWGLGVLAMAGLFSRVFPLAIVAFLLLAQEIQLKHSIAALWPENMSMRTCPGEVRVNRVITHAEAFVSLSGSWLGGACEALAVGDRLKVVFTGSQAIQVGDQLYGQFRLKPIVAMVNPGAFDARRHALSEGWRGQATLSNAEITTPKSFRASAQGAVSAWPQPLRGLGLALLFGEKDDLEPGFKAVFEGFGLSHILAISGLHVGVVLAACWWLFAKSPWPTDPRCRVLLRAGVVCLASLSLAIWTLSSPSVVRAGLMASLFSLLPLWDRRIGLGSVLSMTLCVILIWDATAVLSTGLLMSAGAVALIAVLLWANPSVHWTALIRMQLGFSLLLAPILSMTLGFVYPWLGIIANLLFVPMLPVLLVALLGLLVTQWGWGISRLNALLEGMVTHLELLLEWSLWSQTPSDAVLWILLCLGMLLCFPRPLPLRVIVIGLMLIGVGLFSPSQRRLTIHDIGQGSAATLTVGRESVVFDLAAGQADRWSRISQLYPQVWDPTRLRLSVSHGDLDHLGGLSDLLNRASIPLSVDGGGSLPGMFRQCSPLRVGEVAVHVLWPIHAFSDEENHRSCVLLIEASEHRILLLGDADWLAEAWVIRTLRDRDLLGQVDIVVVSHHGASDGSSPSFVQLINAKAALISVGRHNRYGHPDSEVIARWQASGAAIYRTDLDGALRIDLTSGTIQRERQRAPRRWNHWSDGRPRDRGFGQLRAGSQADG